jgi:uncharacterized membrane protein YoaK (UPF0700 family)
MFHHGLNTDFTRIAAFHWYLMSFLAGSVNAGGFLACGSFVTHITGFLTLSGIDIANSNWLGAIAILSVPGYYLVGVMISARLTAIRAHRGQTPNYAGAMALVALCLFIAATAGSLDVFGMFGAGFYLQQNYLLLVFLCMAAGLQNAAITTSSGATVRTTHLTGLTTDLGIGLVTAFECRKDRPKYSALARKNRLRIGTIFAFLAGGAAGATLFLHVGYLGFLLPTAIACYAVFIAGSYGKAAKAPA